MRRIGRWFLAVVILIIAVAIAATIIGTRLSAEHVASGSLDVAAPVDSVWALISDFQRQPAWREGLREVRPMPARAGIDVWQEVYTDGETLILETTERVPPTRLVRTIADPEAMFSGRWEYDLTPSGAGTRLAITERGRVPNPFFRFVARYLIGHTAQVDAFLRDLDKRVKGS